MKSASVTLLACVLITLVLGSIHAFSVFLVPFEDLLQAPRAQISLIYSSALVCLTFLVLIGYKIYPLFNAPAVAGLSCLLAAVGTLISGHSSSYFWVFVGYAVVFGGANGLGYGFALQLSAQAMPQRKGIAMGTVTAFYALGAAIAPTVYKLGLSAGGLSSAMNLASMIFIVTAIIVYLLLGYSKAHYKGESTISSEKTEESRLMQFLLWLAYGSGCACGLMVLGHATGIVQSTGASAQLAVISLTFIALSNMAGGLIAGWLADRIKLRILLYLLPFCSAVAAILLSMSANVQILIAGLIIIGFTYGAIIAIYPLAVSILFGAGAASKIYGRVFTAWGLAGLAGPWFAGYLFDESGAYTVSLLTAGLVSLISMLAVYFIGPIVNQSHIES